MSIQWSESAKEAELYDAAKEAYDHALGTTFKNVPTMLSVYDHPGTQRRGAIVYLSNEQFQRGHVEALATAIAKSERKAMEDFVAAHPGAAVVWVQNWPLEAVKVEDANGVGLKLTTRGGPSTVEAADAFERQCREQQRTEVENIAALYGPRERNRGIQYVEVATLVKVLAGELVPIVRDGTKIVDVFAEVVGGPIGVKVAAPWIQAVPAGSVLPTVTDAIRFEPAARGYAGLDVNQERARTVSSSIDSTSPRRATSEFQQRIRRAVDETRRELFESHVESVPAIGSTLPATVADVAQVEALQADGRHPCRCADAVLMASGCQCGGV